ARRMETVEVVAWIDRVRQPAGDLHADDVRGEQISPKRAIFFGKPQRGGENGAGRGCQLSARGFHGRRKLRVIVIEHVTLDAVRERGEARRSFVARPDDRSFARAGELRYIPADMDARALAHSGDHGRDAVEDVVFRGLSDGARNVIEARGGDKIRDPRG